MKVGGCQCGAVRFEVTGAARDVYACHCRECRKQSASAFGLSVIHEPEALRLVAGSPKSWVRQTDSGGSLTCWFCETCGSRLWHADDDIVSIKGGAFDDPPEPWAHIWTSRKLPWLILPDGAKTSEREPESGR